MFKSYFLPVAVALTVAVVIAIARELYNRSGGGGRRGHCCCRNCCHHHCRCCCCHRCPRRRRRRRRCRRPVPCHRGSCRCFWAPWCFGVPWAEERSPSTTQVCLLVVVPVPPMSFLLSWPPPTSSWWAGPVPPWKPSPLWGVMGGREDLSSLLLVDC